MNKPSQVSSDLGHRFFEHLSAINNDVTPAEAQLLWMDITARYNETQRTYHSLRHIEHLFVAFDEIDHYLHEPHLIALALYYHDVIYDPMRSDNELKSAEYVLKTLQPYLPVEQCNHIYALIIMTATHQLDGLADKQKCSDAAYLLDMDLSILGAPWSEYERYAQAIRCEYAHVSTNDYRTGRIAILKKLSVHPQLYLTDYYHERLETQARNNIEREIMLLRASE